MCRHVLNAQCSIRAQCCRQWFDCSQCHAEVADHPLAKTYEMVFACKACKRVSRKDTRDYDEVTDSHCPHCDILWVREAITPETLGLQKATENGGGMVHDGPDIRAASGLVYDPRQKYRGPDFSTDDDARHELEREMRLLKEEAQTKAQSGTGPPTGHQTFWTGQSDIHLPVRNASYQPTEDELAELLES